MIVAAASVAIFMAMVDMTIVTTILPRLGKDFGVAPQGAQWALIAYGGAMVAFLLPSGRWLDRTGPWGALLLAVSGFVVTSVLIAAAPTFVILAALRAVQGIFAALLVAQVPGLVVRSVPLSQTGRAFAVVGTVGPLGAVSGPPLGNVLSALGGWQAVFLVNIPIGLVIVVLAAASMPRTGRLVLPTPAMLTEAVTVAAAGAALFAALTLAAEPRPAYLTVAALAALALLFGAGWARLPAGRAVGSLLRLSGLRAGTTLQFLLSLVGGAMLLLPPFSLDQVFASGPLQATLVLVAAPLGMSVTGSVGGLLADRWGAGRAVLTGTGITLVSVALLAAAPHAGGAELLGLRLACVGVGLGLAAGPNQAVVMRGAPPDMRGSAGAVSATLRQLGFVVAPALCMLVWVSLGGSTGDLARAYLVPLVATVAAAAVAIRLVRLGTENRPEPHADEVAAAPGSSLDSASSEGGQRGHGGVETTPSA